MKPNARDEDVPARARSLQHVVSPPHVFTENGDGTLTITASISNRVAGGRPDAVSRSGRYFGAFQWDLSSWRGLGESGSPIDYSYEYQLGVAKRMQAARGWRPWPTCSRRLGLL